MKSLTWRGEVPANNGIFKPKRGAFRIWNGSRRWLKTKTILRGAAPTVVILLGTLRAAEAQPTAATTNQPAVTLEQSLRGIWQAGIGEGFRASAESFGVGLGAGYGVAAFGGRESHDLALLGLTYGHMLSDTKGEGHWYRGNWEFRIELFSGAQFSPETDWLVGLTPHLRYDFATGTRWVPFFDLGAGISGTSIGAPDLSGTFEFNLQSAAGVHWFLEDDLALSVEARYLHMSCASISKPNLGLNTVMGVVSVTWFF
jgi:hypothetical protein